MEIKQKLRTTIYQTKSQGKEEGVNPRSSNQSSPFRKRNIRRALYEYFKLINRGEG